MRFVYNHKQYEVMEMHDIHGISFMGMVVLFEVQYVHYEKGSRVFDSEEDFLAQDDHEDSPFIFEELRFVNHFPIDSRDHQEIIENCQYFIDHEYDKDFDECKYLMKQVRKAQIEFEKDIREGNREKSSLEALEYAQSDLYDYIRDNIEVEEDDVAPCYSLNNLVHMMKMSNVDMESQSEIRQFLTSKGINNEIQIEIVRDLGFTPFEEEDWR